MRYRAYPNHDGKYVSTKLRKDSASSVSLLVNSILYVYYIPEIYPSKYDMQKKLPKIMLNAISLYLPARVESPRNSSDISGTSAVTSQDPLESGPPQYGARSVERVEFHHIGVTRSIDLDDRSGPEDYVIYAITDLKQ